MPTKMSNFERKFYSDWCKKNYFKILILVSIKNNKGYQDLIFFLENRLNQIK